jgi:hypothetical protein
MLQLLSNEDVGVSIPFGEIMLPIVFVFDGMGSCCGGILVLLK